MCGGRQDISIHIHSIHAHFSSLNEKIDRVYQVMVEQPQRLLERLLAIDCKSHTHYSKAQDIIIRRAHKTAENREWKIHRTNYSHANSVRV